MKLEISNLGQVSAASLMCEVNVDSYLARYTVLTKNWTTYIKKLSKNRYFQRCLSIHFQIHISDNTFKLPGKSCLIFCWAHIYEGLLQKTAWWSELETVFLYEPCTTLRLGSRPILKWYPDFNVSTNTPHLFLWIGSGLMIHFSEFSSSYMTWHAHAVGTVSLKVQILHLNPHNYVQSQH
jgi:hypothetical protein